MALHLAGSSPRTARVMNGHISSFLRLLVPLTLALVHSWWSPAVAGPHAAATCDGQTTTKTGTPGDDVTTGTEGPDVIAALGGDDYVRGGPSGAPGADVMCGGDGHDLLLGMGGADRLFGGPGNDGLHGRFGDDTQRGGPGRDIVTGGGGDPGDDDLAGGLHADLL